MQVLDPLPRQQLKGLLAHDCGLSSADVSQFLAAGRREIENEDLLLKHGVSVEVVAALQTTSDDVRAEVYRQIASGKRVATKMLTQLKQRAQAADPVALRKKRSDSLAAQVAR